MLWSHLHPLFRSSEDRRCWTSSGNSLHVACSKADGVDAYETLPYPHAACTGQLTDFDHDCFLHWQHSILTSPKYHNPFTAVLSAWDLRWNVLCDQFAHTYQVCGVILPMHPMSTRCIRPRTVHCISCDVHPTDMHPTLQLSTHMLQSSVVA